MNMETAICAICKERVPLDSDHVKVETETFHTGYRNDINNFIFCMDCKIEKFNEWSKPA